MWWQFEILVFFTFAVTRSLCGDESGLRAGGRVPLASLGKVLVKPMTAIIIVYGFFLVCHSI